MQLSVHEVSKQLVTVAQGVAAQAEKLALFKKPLENRPVTVAHHPHAIGESPCKRTNENRAVGKYLLPYPVPFTCLFVTVCNLNSIHNGHYQQR